jgi:hypothetical protein
MNRRFWQVVEDPEYIEDWSEYYHDEENLHRGVEIRQTISLVKINGEEVPFNNTARQYVD